MPDQDQHAQVLMAIENLRQAQATAMADAIRSVLTSPEDISAFLDLVAAKAQERATTAAGRGVWWLAKAMLSRWLVIGLIVLTLAKIGGWDVAAKVGKWLTSWGAS
jgi:hypothetical protein